MTRYLLRLTREQHEAIRRHVFPSDGNEAVALVLCGRRNSEARHVLTVRRIVPVPYEACRVRTPDRVTWPTDYVDPLIAECRDQKQAIIKFHGHSGEYARFSSIDDRSDRTLFASVSGLVDDGLPHASVIMLNDGRCFGRVVQDGDIVDQLAAITVVGDDISIWTPDSSARLEAFAERHAQAFGSGTIHRLRSMSAGVVGCSGTGSLVAEQLARLGIGRLVLVDPDRVEEKNLNRIVNSGKEDAYLQRPKVHVLATAIARMGLGQEVLPLPMNLATTEAVLRVAECDVVFGCMDGVEGRHLLNRIATFYSIPYFDVGVRLDADGVGGIESIAGAVHYLQPGRSSLLSRGLYTIAQLEAEEMRRTNPELYERHREEGYLRGVGEDRPAVISVNMFFASMLVNEFLARLHPYRNRSNADFAYIGGNLNEVGLFPETEADDCKVLRSHVGRGDVDPLLERTNLQ